MCRSTVVTHLLLFLAVLSCRRANPLAPTVSTVSVGTLSVPPIAFGTLNLVTTSDHGEGEGQVARRVLESVPPGTLIDTAERYGGGRGRCEDALAGAASELGVQCGCCDEAGGGRWPVATKFAPSPTRLGPSSVVEACKESASRLGVDAIDLYQIHYRDLVQPLKFLGLQNVKDEEYWDGLAECVHKGLARNVGVCNYGPTMVRRAHDALARRGVPLVSNQINFNLMRFRSSVETKAVCDELGIKVLAYHPLAGGILTDKYDLNDVSTFSSISKYSRHRMRYFLRETEALRSTLRTIASNHGGATTGQVAINWVRGKGAIPIVGGKNPRQVEENSGALDFTLTDGEMSMLDDASNESVEYYEGFELV